MQTRIKLLPKNVINQIAAGEVIQRPSSIVKELIDNSIDAKSKNIHLIIKDSGKTHIQINDDGEGMNKKEMSICFERHTTSKIKNTEDIFHINTLGFRGEALSSIASVSKLIIKSKSKSQDIGNQIIIEQGLLQEEKEIVKSVGTEIIVKNLFFNIPARKNFLKSNKVELKHIVDEFFRAALTNENINFKLSHDGSVLFSLKQENRKKRIANLFGKNITEKIIPIQEETDIVQISGFLGKPNHAKKTRGEQFFFVNNRYVKAPYLHHAIMNAFEGLIQKDVFISYFIYLKIDTKKIDLNVHPSKTEIKFEDDKLIYSILLSAAKRSIGKFNISPSIDFETESSFSVPTYSSKFISEPKIEVNKSFNPFDEIKSYKTTNNIETLFNIEQSDIKEEESIEISDLIQINNSYIFCVLKNSENISNCYLLNQNKSHQRIIFEDQLNNLKNKKIISQKLAFTEEIIMTKSDLIILKQNEELFNEIGYNFEKINDNKLVIDGIPSFVKKENIKEKIELFLEEIKNKNLNIKIKVFEKLAKSVAYSSSIKMNEKLEKIEMVEIIKSLFKCESPFISLDGTACMVNFDPKNLFDLC